MTNTKQAFTPCSISQDPALFFSIPLYQRLFEWGDEQISQLLDDLLSSYRRNPKSPYYIGMLTAKETGSSKELVDGQQRFTAMVLLGIHFGWDDFLSVSGKPRLMFTARDEDKEYLQAKLGRQTPSYKNEKMEKGLACISGHLAKHIAKEEMGKFGNYIYNNLTFFLSKLPDEYSAQELNTYFERMNTSGKSLENYEILKVDVIRRLDADKEKYTQLWNAVSVMEKKILRKHNREPFDSLRGRYLNAMSDMISNGNVENAYEKHSEKFDAAEEDNDADESDEYVEPKAIGDIPVNTENPFKIVKRRSDEHSLLTFPEFLLQVLFICLNEDLEVRNEAGETVEEMNTTDFFDVRKLCNTFKWAFEKKGLDARSFMLKLGLYRLLTDYFIIRMNDEDEEPYPFVLYKADEKGKMKVRMFLAMLYSASSAMTYYMWMPKLLRYLEDYVRRARCLELDAEDYLAKLKSIDNEWHPREDVRADELTYKTIDRYWFWRIDYYLWEQRELFFKDDSLRRVAEKYVFRRNRSIEHIAPQHPNDEFDDRSRFCWGDEGNPSLAAKRDCLGNMVMISSGQNSTLTNSCFEVKCAVMRRYASGTGKVESLKMLYVYSKYGSWSIDRIDEHLQFSLDLLDLTYKDDASAWERFAFGIG